MLRATFWPCHAIVHTGFGVPRGQTKSNKNHIEDIEKMSVQVRERRPLYYVVLEAKVALSTVEAKCDAGIVKT